MGADVLIESRAASLLRRQARSARWISMPALATARASLLIDALGATEMSYAQLQGLVGLSEAALDMAIDHLLSKERIQLREQSGVRYLLARPSAASHPASLAAVADSMASAAVHRARPRHRGAADPRAPEWQGIHDAEESRTCCDGTANEFARHNTNVVKLYNMLVHEPVRQCTVLPPGPGHYGAGGRAHYTGPTDD